MARRKKKTRLPNEVAQASVSVDKKGINQTQKKVSEKKEEAGLKPNSIKKDTGQAEPKKELIWPRKSVSVSTCIAGMFLTLVLGVYLGTLMPGIMVEMTKPQTPAEKANVAQEPVAASGPQAMDPSLLKMVGELEKRAKDNPDSVTDWINLGNIYFDSYRPEKAIEAYEHALKLAPANADVLTDLGIMYRETGQFDKALESFRKAIAINPRHENAMYNEGVVLSSDLKKPAEAMAAWQRLLEINPQAHAPDGRPVSEMIRHLQ